MTHLLATITVATLFAVATWQFFRRGYVNTATALVVIGVLLTTFVWQIA